MLWNSDLKVRLTVRVVAVTGLCFVAIAAYVLVDAHLSARGRVENIARIAARDLELQKSKLEWVKGQDSSFPDLQVLASEILAPGLCLAYRGPEGHMEQRHCIGDQTPDPPIVFATLYAALFQPGREAVQRVMFRGRAVGEAVAWGDAGALTAQAWQAVHPLLAAMAVTLPLLAVLVHMALARALQPTRVIRAGLKRMAAGDLSTRLPAFDLAELSALSGVFNHLAESLGTALAERAALTRRLIALRDDERKHLARELHDEFGQDLAAIRALAAAGQTAECTSIGRTATAMMETLRGALFRLRPPEIEEVGLSASLHGLVDGWNGRSQGRTRFEIRLDGRLDALPSAVGSALYRIAQEALTNAAKHASASRVSLALSLREREVVLSVDDDGQCCDADPAARSGLGLLGMRERVDSLGGRMRFETGYDAGSNLSVVIPVERAA